MIARALTTVLLMNASACTFAFWYKDFATPAQKLDIPRLHLLSLGMTKSQVHITLGEPDQVSDVRRTESGTIETWEYFRMEAVPGPDRIAERHFVEFTDGKLSAYGSSGDSRHEVGVRSRP